MDLNLQHTMLDHYQVIMDTVLTQEETTESIIPDAFPDVSRIICATGDGVVQTKQCEDGGIVVMGMAQLCVLYVPDGDSNARALTVNVPFRCAGSCPGIDSNTLVHTSILSVSADARTINPRKLFLKGEVRVSVRAFRRSAFKVVSDITDETDVALQKQMRQCTNHFVAAVAEKPFLFSDTLRISASKPTMEELLNFSQESCTVETKYIGKRMVCKGEMRFSALYRSGGELLSTKFEVPFSQVLDTEGGVDEGEADAVVTLKNVEYQLRDGELDVSVEALIQATLWSKKEVTLLSDVYSTAVLLDVERSGTPICTMSHQSSSRESARKFCESGIPAQQVLYCTVSLKPMILHRETGHVEYSVGAEASVLYLSEDHALCGVSYDIPVSGKEDLPADCSCSCQYRLVGDPVAVPVTGGFEIRLELEFIWRTAKTEMEPCVSSVIQSGKQIDAGQKPSIIIRMVNSGEELWDIAKSCGSTIQDICTANELSSELAVPGTVLLIPTGR